MRDVTDLFNDLKNGTLPAVSFVKPDGAMDGHPNSSKLDLFEAFAKNIVALAQSNKERMHSGDRIYYRDEGGGYYGQRKLHSGAGLSGTGRAFSSWIAMNAFLEGRAYQPFLASRLTFR